MEESCGDDDDDVEWRDKESGVFVVTSSCKKKESWKNRVAQPSATIRWIRSV